jgi:hypothetical protein
LSGKVTPDLAPQRIPHRHGGESVTVELISAKSLKLLFFPGSLVRRLISGGLEQPIN